MACSVTVKNGTLEQNEINAYIARATQKYGVEPLHIDINVCGDEVELDYDLGARPFHRIRRITGYLVGTLDRFNNAKRAEEQDRVKHSIG
ncbi:MAG: anaerobic ribonucleoside-triphosphate reductase [Eubacteriales bacterium]|nr:anaerobic ribonucleoside-triphosphate reductase [Eubacteriales bacterium]